MRYQISGKQIDIGKALKTHVENELGSVIEKYAERPTDAHVVFSKASNEFVCEATVHLSTGLTAQAKAHEHEIYAAFDKCSEKMENNCAVTSAALKIITARAQSLLNLPGLRHIFSRLMRQARNRNPKACSRSSLPRWKPKFPLSRLARR